MENTTTSKPAPNTPPLLLKHLLFWALLALISLAPLPFGSNRPLPWSILALITGTILTIWSLTTIKYESYINISMGRVRFIVIPFLLLLVWSLYQSYIPWPESFIHPLWKETASALNSATYPSLTTNKHHTIDNLMRLLTYGCAFWIALQFGRSTKNATLIFKTIAISGGVYALYGLLVYFSGAEKILWFEKDAYIGSLTSTFINRNSYATYAGICLIISFSLLMIEVFKGLEHLQGKKLYGEIINNIATKSPLYLIITLLIITALILTNSRAGIVSSALGSTVALVIIGLTPRMRNFRHIFLITASVFITIFISLYLIGGDAVMARFERIGNDFYIRTLIYNVTFETIKDYPFTGIGLGSFEDVFRIYRDASLPLWMEQRIDHAHNTYLESLLELGIPAFLLIMTSTSLIVITCFQGLLRRKRNLIFPAIGIAVSALVAIHSFFDFSLEMPAIALVYCVIMGVCCSQSWSTRINMTCTPDNKDGTVWYRPTTSISVIVGAILCYMGIWSTLLETKNISVQESVQALKTGKKVKENHLLKMVNTKNKLFSLSKNGDWAIEASLGEFTLAYNYGVFSKKGSTYLQQAKKHLEDGLKVSPASPYAWLRLAYINMLLNGSEESVYRPLAMSIITAPYEPALVFYRLKFAMVMWNKLQAEQKDLVHQQIRIAWNWSPQRTLRYLTTPFSHTIIRESLVNFPSEIQKLEKMTSIR